MKKLVLAAIAASALMAGCWVPVQISAAGGASGDVVYVLDWKYPSYFAPEGRVMRCDGPGRCAQVYAP